MLLTFDELKERLSRLSYKDWKMNIYEGHFEGLHFEIHAEMPDNFNPGSPFKFHCVSALPHFFTTEQFDFWVFDRLKRIEIHECMENFKLDGELLYNPHRESADRDLL